jgi:hypothetical protein
MTPTEETALELVNKFRRITDEKGLRVLKLEYAKQCALIAVDEIILANPHSNTFTNVEYSTMEYWKEVKQEIEKL